MKNLKTGVFTLFMLMLFNISIQAQNYALRFNGNNNLVQSSKGFALQENSPTTLELWVKLDTVVWTTFIRLGMNLQTVGMNEYGELFTISNNTGPWHYNNTGFFLETGKWYHIAAVFCNAYSTVYVNGTQQGSRRYSPNENNSQSNKIFLGYCLDGIHRYKGIIDEVRVWSMARTEDEIRQNMCDTITGNEPNLRCYYRMTDGTGAILTDNSYNHDTATLINMGDSSWIKDFQIPDGSGISSDPFQLEAINHLFWFSNHHEHWGDGKHIVQSSDIDATYCTYWNDGLGFAPIGIDYDSKFQGNYDGQGHVIQNLRIERINQDYLGFFGFISGATIQNLGMTDLYSFGRGDIGGLVGFSSNSVIKNCFVKGVVFARDKFAGGLIGRITNSSVNYCHAEGNIEIMVSVAGGLIGGSSFDNTISNCYSKGEVTALQAGGTTVGGFIGSVSGSTDISNCFSSAQAKAINSPGGFAGTIYEEANLSNCYAIGSVQGREAGGFVSRMYGDASIAMCYAAGKVIGWGEEGGFCYSKTGNAVVNTSFWDRDTTGVFYSAGGEGKTTAEMKTAKTFTDAGWDFAGESVNGTNDYWSIDNTTNDGYPWLTRMLDNIWQGDDEVSPTSWNTGSNWSMSQVPSASDHVIIPDVENDPVVVSDSGASCYNLTLDSNTTLTIESGASLITNGIIFNNGIIAIKRTITPDTWHWIGLPIKQGTAQLFSGDHLEYFMNPSYYYWEEITDPSANLEVMEGYRLLRDSTGNGTYTFTGTPNTGDQSKVLKYFNPTPGWTSAGWNFFGNPYPSSLDWGTLVERYGTVYFWNSENSQTAQWNSSGSINGGQQYVPPQQGFMIWTKKEHDTLFLANSNRVHAKANFFYKDALNPVTRNIRLESSNEAGQMDEWLLVLDENAIQGFEMSYDGWHIGDIMNLSSDIPCLYSISPDGPMGIDRRPFEETIQLGFSAEDAGIYTIGIDELSGISTLVLEDTKESNFHDLFQEEYNFTWDPADDEQRFVLHLSILGVDEISTPEDILIYSYEKTVFLKNLHEPQTGTFTLTDLSGRKVMEKTISVNGTVSLITQLNPGIYIACFRNSDGVTINELVIR